MSATIPKIEAEDAAQFHGVLKTEQGKLRYPGHVIVDGDNARDIRSTAKTSILLPGLPLGKLTSGGLYAASVIGKTDTAYTGGVTLAVTPATAVELLRRYGASGSAEFNVVGAPAAAGVVSKRPVSHSAINVTTGDITVTALGPVDEVQTIAIGVAADVDETQQIVIGGTASAGTFTIAGRKSDGSWVVTGPITYDGTWNTFLASMNTALDAVFGASGVVLTGASHADITATFSGTGYTHEEQPLLEVDVGALTGTTTANVVELTKGTGVLSEGTFRLGITHPTTGVIEWTGPIAYNANAAAIQTAVDAAIGTTECTIAGTVASFTVTFDGVTATYNALPIADIKVDVSNLVGAAVTVITETTGGSNYTFVSGSLIVPNDGSETPLVIIGDESPSGYDVLDDDGVTNLDIDIPGALIGGILQVAKIAQYPTSTLTTLVTWFKSQLRGKGQTFICDDDM